MLWDSAESKILLTALKDIHEKSPLLQFDQLLMRMTSYKPLVTSTCNVHADLPMSNCPCRFPHNSLFKITLLHLQRQELKTVLSRYVSWYVLCFSLYYKYNIKTIEQFILNTFIINSLYKMFIRFLH